VVSGWVGGREGWREEGREARTFLEGLVVEVVRGADAGEDTVCINKLY